jgi:WD40 repeat protein
VPDFISRLLVEPGGERALLGQGQQLVEVDRDGKPVPTGARLPLETEGPMALSPDGRRVAALGYPPGYHLNGGLPAVPHQKGVLVVADRRTGKVLVRTTVAGDEGAPEEGGMAFSPDGRRLAVGTWGGVLTMLDSATGRVLAERRTDSSSLRALRWSRDGTVLYEGGGDGVLRFLDPATLKTETAVPLTAGVNFALNAVVPVPRTSLLAVAGDAGQVFFVDVGRRERVGQPLAAQGAQLLALALSPDGSVIAGVGWDGALRLWDRASGQAIGPPLSGHDGYTRSIAWLDPEHLLTGSFDGRLIAWDMAPSDWVARACALAGRELTRAEWSRYLPVQPYRRTCGVR